MESFNCTRFYIVEKDLQIIKIFVTLRQKKGSFKNCSLRNQNLLIYGITAEKTFVKLDAKLHWSIKQDHNLTKLK